MTTTSPVAANQARPTDPTLHAAVRLAAVFAIARLLFQFALTLYTQHIGWGYFRDEFYYIACGRHLAWGYVDHGPIVALQARLAETLFGDSLFAIRIFSAAAEAFALFLSGVLTWALGGGRSAQALAMTGLFVAPITIAMGGFLSMNSFEPMFWTGCVLALVLLLRGRSPALCWAAFGISAGIGLLNKPSMTFFLIALCLGLLLTPQRPILFTRWAALGIALLLLIALPNVLWQIQNHWPTLEFLHNGRIHHKNVALPPLRFFFAQIIMLHPLNALLWITGVVALLRAKSIQNARWLGLTYLFFYVIMNVFHAKDYYLAPIYPALFAAGAIAWEFRFAHSPRGVSNPAIARSSLFAFPICQTALIVTGAIILPMSSPILRPSPWLAYTRALHLTRAADETEETSDLPQFYADRFAWQEMTDQLTAAYRSLTPADQAQVCIGTDNYGEAGAIDFFNRTEHLGLPPSISHHNNYWIWGPHGCNGKVVLDITDANATDLRDYYATVEIVGTINVPHSMPEEHKHIYLLRNRKPEHPITWEKHYI